MTPTDLIAQEDMGLVSNIGQLFDQKSKELQKAIPSENVRSGLLAAIIAESTRNPALLECVPHSFLTAAIKCASYGLMPGPHDWVYLIPRKNHKLGNKKEINVDIGYKGYIRLGERHPDVDKVIAKPVFRGEEGTFELDNFTGEVKHPFTPGISKVPDNLFLVYATAKLANGMKVTEYLEHPDDIKRVMERTTSRDSNGEIVGAWITDYIPMAIKSAIRKLFNGGQVPMDDDLAAELAAETRREVEQIKRAEFTEVGEPVRGAQGLLNKLNSRDAVSDDAAAESQEDGQEPMNREGMIDRIEELCIEKAGGDEVEASIKLKAFEKKAGGELVTLSDKSLAKLCDELQSRMNDK